MLADASKGVRNAFSLVEVVIAVGIVAFVLMAILGLFPVGLRISNDSQRETRCGMIAQELFAALRIGPPESARLSMVPGGSLAGERVDLTVAGSTYVELDSEGEPVALLDASAAQAPRAGDRAAYVAEIRVTPDDPNGGTSRVEVFLQHPAVAAAAQRTVYPFADVLLTP